MAFNEFCRLKMPYDILCMYDHEFRSIGAVTWKYEGFLLRAQARKDNSQCALPTPVFATQASCIYLTLSGAAPLTVSKGQGGGHIVPPLGFWGCWGGYGFKFSLQPHILLRLTPDKRIYNFQIPRTTPTNGLKKLLFQGFLEVRKGTPLWNFAKLDQLFEFLGKRWIFLE